MDFIKCKNEAEKLSAIKSYCNRLIEWNNQNIYSYKMDCSSPLDYAYEIRELENRNECFKKIVKIIEANEFTYIMLD